MQKHSFLKMTIALTVACSICGCSSTTAGIKKETSPDPGDMVLVNQVGYRPDAQKVALIRTGDNRFEVVDETSGNVVYKGLAEQSRYWEFSGDSVSPADFTPVSKPGRYFIRLDGTGVRSCSFSVEENIYHNITKAAAKAFYFNRSGFAITEEYGTKWARAAGHPDTAVIIHESAASGTRPAGTVISSPGGWYDAGDYNKYIVNSSITVFTMLLFYQLYPSYCDTLKLDIPENRNDLPDIADEILYNLRWMMTMQDPADGGVYHKLTNKVFNDFEMPEVATEPRYVVSKSTQATLDFAATMAMASRVFAGDAHPQLKELSPACLDAARKAIIWARKNPGILYKQPDDIKTGEYGGRDIREEWSWATTEMALAEGDPSGLDTDKIKSMKPSLQSWDAVEMLGIISLSVTDSPVFSEMKASASAALTAFSDILVQKSLSSPYRVSLDFFKWGSNSDVANQALLKLIAYRITGDKLYLPSVQGDIDYLLGRNATGYCFVTGFGSKSPMDIHHRPSGADGIPEPVPGFLAGGPNTVVMNDCDTLVKRSPFPARSYADVQCSYSTNEICINWNAPLFFILGATDAERRR